MENATRVLQDIKTFSGLAEGRQRKREERRSWDSSQLLPSIHLEGMRQNADLNFTFRLKIGGEKGSWQS